MTTDHTSLLNLLGAVRGDLSTTGLIQDGTAIGMGLANAVGRLKNVKGKSKVVILLTDGSNNVGDISPLTAAAIAKKFGIRVYTIGLGTDGKDAQGQLGWRYRLQDFAEHCYTNRWRILPCAKQETNSLRYTKI